MASNRISSDRRIVQTAQKLELDVRHEAHECALSPDRARRKGVARVPAMGLFASLEAQSPGSAKAEWLRGAAQALVPVGYRYEITESQTGEPKFTITGYEAPALGAERRTSQSLFR